MKIILTLFSENTLFTNPRSEAVPELHESTSFDFKSLNSDIYYIN